MNQPDWDIERRGMMQQIKMLQRELELERTRSMNAEDYAAAAIEIAAEQGVKMSSESLIQRVRNNREKPCGHDLKIEVTVRGKETNS